MLVRRREEKDGVREMKKAGRVEQGMRLVSQHQYRVTPATQQREEKRQGVRGRREEEEAKEGVIQVTPAAVCTGFEKRRRGKQRRGQRGNWTGTMTQEIGE